MPSGAVQAQSLSKASDVQISPNMPYNNISTEHPIEPSTGMNPFTLLSRSDNVSPNYASYRASSVAVGAVAPVQATNTHTTLGHAHSASQSSISSCTNSLSGSPAPSLSGSDDSGNTSKSTLSQLSISNLSGNRSNPSSRRGSISVSNTGANAGTPYGSARKDGDKKFVCSYPGCTRAFSRNFNLSTHYNTHLGIKPFPCSHCPKSFSRRHDCARHIAAVHASEANNSKNRNIINGGLDGNGSISPNSCGCGHTCPAHNKLSNNTISTMQAGIPASSTGTTVAGNGEDSGNYRTSAFAFIKGERQVEDDLLSSSSGYESTTSSSSYSIDSFIGRFNNNNLDTTVNMNTGSLSYMHPNENSRSPSFSAFPNIGLVKLEDDGEGE